MEEKTNNTDTLNIFVLQEVNYLHLITSVNDVNDDVQCKIFVSLFCLKFHFKVIFPYMLPKKISTVI